MRSIPRFKNPSRGAGDGGDLLAGRLGLAPSPWLRVAASGLAFLYGLGAKAHRDFSRRGLLPQRRLPAPVVSVGNLTVGGTGKTPLVAHLARELRRRGLEVVVLSRGYGGRQKGVTCVSDGRRLCATPPAVGDEAFLLAWELPGVPVYSGASRYAAGLAAWRRHGPDLFLLDDGFQHLSLHRDLDVVLLDAAAPWGNGRLLPAGPLREPPATLELADLLVLTRFDPERHQETLARFAACYPDKDILTSGIVPVGVRRFPGGEPRPLEDLQGTPCFAFAGLARPQVFRHSLEQLGAHLRGWHGFPDHHPFSGQDLAGLEAAARAAGAQALVTTAKDVARLGNAWELALPLFVLEVAATLEPWETLWARVEELVGPAGGEAVGYAGWLPGALAAAGRGSPPAPGLPSCPPAARRAWEGLKVGGGLPPEPGTVRHLLLRAPNWLGDAVMALPVLAALKKRFPGADITVLAVPRVAPLFAGHPLVRQTLTYPTGLGKLRLLWGLRQRFQVGVALPNSLEAALSLFLAGAKIRVGYAADGRRLLLTRPVAGREVLREMHLVFYYLGILRAFGEVGAADLTPPRLYVAPAEGREAEALLSGGLLGDGPWVGLAPGAAYGPAKRWPAERFAEVARELTGQSGVRVVVLGGADDREAAGVVAAQAGVPVLNLAGRTTLRQALAVLSRLKVLITNDSGLMHAAAALSVPVVAIFGSTNPRATAPFTPRSTVLHHGLECSPCLKRTCDRGYPCLTAVTVGEVLAAARAWLEFSGPEHPEGGGP